MNLIQLLESSLCTRLCLTFAHFLWIGALIAVLSVVTAKTLGSQNDEFRSTKGIGRKGLRSSEVRYAVYVSSLLIMLLSVVVAFVLVEVPAPAAGPAPLPVFDTVESPVERPIMAPSTVDLPAVPPATDFAPPPISQPVDSIAAKPSSRPSFDWQRLAPYATSLYFLGVILMLGRLLVGLHGGNRLRRASKPVDDPAILSALAKQAKALGLTLTPAVAYCRRVVVPTVVGVVKPTILLPFSFATGLNPDQIEMLLAHELAHIRRYDPLFNVIQRTIEAILFFHPAVWFISRKIRIERENCCDDRVLKAGGAPLSYASSLISVAEKGRRRSRLAVEGVGAVGRSSQLGTRIRRLIGISGHEQVRLQRTWFIVILLGILLVPLTRMSPSGAGEEPAGPRLEIRLLDTEGGPFSTAPIVPASRGYTKEFPNLTRWPDRDGWVKFENLEPGKYLFALATGFANRAVLEIDLPEGGLKTRYQLGVEPDWQGIEPGKPVVEGNIIWIPYENRTDEARTFQRANLTLANLDYRIFPPFSEREPIVIPAKGKTLVTIDWEKWVKEGIWVPRRGETIREIWPADDPDADEIYIRAWLGNYGSLPFAVRKPEVVLALLPSSPDQKWTRNVPHGVKVSLLALGRPSRDSSLWWNPDGNPIAAGATWADQWNRYGSDKELAAVLRVEYREQYPPTDKFAPVQTIVRPVSEPGTGRQPTLQLGVGHGPWWTAKLRERDRLEHGEFTCGIDKVTPDMRKDSARRLQGIITVDAWYTVLPDLDVSLQAIDKGGEAHDVYVYLDLKIEKPEAGITHQLHQPVVNIDVDDVDYFVFGTRPRAWVTFSGFAVDPHMSVDARPEIPEVTAPIRLLPDKSDPEQGRFCWRIERDEPMSTEVWWIIEGKGEQGSTGKLPESGTEEILLETQIENGSLICAVSERNRSGSTRFEPKQSVPEDAEFESAWVSEPTVIGSTNYLPLWEGRFLRDGKLVKRFFLAARVVAPNDPVEHPSSLYPDKATGLRIPLGTPPSERGKAIAHAPRLQFRLVAPEGETENAEEFPWTDTIDDREGSLFLEKEILFDESDIETVGPKQFPKLEEFSVSLELTDDASQRFASVTGSNIGRRLAIVFDGEIFSAPVIRDRIPHGRLQISGNFTREEAEALARAIAGDDPSTFRTMEELKSPHEKIPREMKEKSIEELLDLLGDPEADALKRASAAQALAEKQDLRTVPPLLEMLKDEDETVRNMAAAALCEIGRAAGPPALESLLTAAEDEDSRVRRGVAYALRAIPGNRSLDVLLNSLSDEAGAVRAAAAQSLASFFLQDVSDPRMVPALLAVVDDASPEVRGAAMLALGESHDPRSIDPVINALNDPENYVRYAAMHAAGSLKEKRAVEPLVGALKSTDQVGRSAAVHALRRIGDPRAIGPLKNLADSDPDPHVREAATRALEELENAAAEMESVAWGEEVDGLQLGIRCPTGDQPYRFGEVVEYEVLLRNHTEETVQFRKWIGLQITPFVQENHISLMAVISVRGTLTLETIAVPAGDTLSVEHIAHTIRPATWAQPDSPQSLQVQARRYTVSLCYTLDPTSEKPAVSQMHEWDPNFALNNLCSGTLTLVVLDDADAPEPPKGRTGIRGLQFRWVIQDTDQQPAEEVPWSEDIQGQRGTLRLGKDILFDESDIESVGVRTEPGRDEFHLLLELTDDARERFAEVTGNNVGERLAIVVDGKVSSAPVIREKIPHGRVLITGDFSRKQAEEIADTIVAGNPSITRLEGANDEEAALRAELEAKPTDELLRIILNEKEKGHVQWVAAEILGPRKESDTIEPLIEGLGHENSNVPIAAAKALGAMGDLAIDPLITASRDDDETVRMFACEALRQIPDARTIDPLLDRLEDKSLQVRMTAAGGLGNLAGEGITSRRVVPALIDTARDSAAEVRSAAVFALGMTRDPEAVDPVLNALRDSDSGVRQLAATALGRLGDPAAIDPLITALESDDWMLRVNAALALASIGDETVLPKLHAALKSEKNGRVRQAFQRAVTRLELSSDLTDGGWGEPVEGVRVRLRPDGQVFAATEFVKFRIDLWSEKEIVLPHYGPPLDEFEVILDGERYRADYEFHGGLRSVWPSPATWREGLHFGLTPKFWDRVSDGAPMELRPGEHTLRVRFPFAVDKDESADRRWSVSNQVTFQITAAAKQEDELAWGEPVDGLRVRIQPHGEVSAATDARLFRIELRSEIERTYSYFGHPLASFEMELDGEWYNNNFETVGGHITTQHFPIDDILLALSPATKQAGSDALGSFGWYHLKDGTPFSGLQPGEHALRVRYQFTWEQDGTRKRLWAVSNPVTFEILPAGGEDSSEDIEEAGPVSPTETAVTAWGEPAGDLELGIRCMTGTEPYRFGEEIEFQVVLRNLTDQDISASWMRGRGEWQIRERDLAIRIYALSERDSDVSREELRVPAAGSTVLGTVHRILRPPYADPEVDMFQVSPGHHRAGAEIVLIGLNAEKSSNRTGGPPGHTTTLSSGTLSIQIEYPSEWGWGEPVDGIRARLRPEGQVFQATDWPTFQIDVQSERMIPLPEHQAPVEEIQLDGKWYRQATEEFADSVSIAGSLFSTFEREGLRFTLLSDAWARTDDDTPMRLTPGKHTLRVAGQVYRLGQFHKVISNSVTFEILLGEDAKVSTSPPGAVRKEQVRKLFHLFTREEMVPKEHATEAIDVFPKFEWGDIPTLLELAASTELLAGMPKLGISSHISTRGGYEGMVALWLIDGIRRKQASLLRHEQTGEWISPTYYELSLNPIVCPDGMEIADCELSPEIHRETLQAYRNWWRRVGHLPPQDAAVFDPMDGSNLNGFSHYSENWGEFEFFEKPTPEGFVAKRIIPNLKRNQETGEREPGKIVRTAYYVLKDGAPSVRPPFKKEDLIARKIVLYYYNEAGNEIRTREVVLPPGKVDASDKEDAETDHLMSPGRVEHGRRVVVLLTSERIVFPHSSFTWEEWKARPPRPAELADPEIPVVLRAESDLPHKKVIAVINRIYVWGIKNVSLATVKKESPDATDDPSGVTAPLELLKDQTNPSAGRFTWRIEADQPVRVSSGWISEGEPYAEHVGFGSSTRIEGNMPIDLGLEINEGNGYLQIKTSRTWGSEENGSQTSSLGSKTSIPAGCEFEAAWVSGERTIGSIQFLTLWEGRFVRDGEVMKRILYAAILLEPYGPHATFVPSIEVIENPPRSGEISARIVGEHRVNESGWGEPVEGVQIRVKPDKTVWKEDEMPVLHAEGRNGGTRPLHLPESGAHWQIEVDGHWYSWNINGDLPMQGTKLLRFLPGDSQTDIRIPVTDGYQRIRDEEEMKQLIAREFSAGVVWIEPASREVLTLRPGKHILRVACIASPASAGIYTPVRAISNAVEINILPADEEESSGARKESAARQAAAETDPRREHVRKLFHMYTREGKIPNEYRRRVLEPVPHFEWTDIPYLLELAESEMVLKQLPQSPLSSGSAGAGKEGMVAIWVIEGLRSHLPLDPHCTKESLRSSDEIAHPEIHREVVRAYQEWWQLVHALPREDGALFHPLDLTDIRCAGKDSAPLVTYREPTPDGIVAERTTRDIEFDSETREKRIGKKLRSIYYGLRESSADANPPYREENLVPRKMVLYSYDDSGNQTGARTIVPGAGETNLSTEPPEQESAVGRAGANWGEEQLGIRLGLRCTSRQPAICFGEVVEYEIILRNAAGRPVRVEKAADVRSWSAKVRGSDLDLLVADYLATGVIQGATKPPPHVIPPGETATIDTIAYTLRPIDWEGTDSPPALHIAPGTYSVSTSYRIDERPDGLVLLKDFGFRYPDTAQHEISTGEHPLHVVEHAPEQGWGEPVEGVRIRITPEKPVWKADQIPVLRAQGHNTGTWPLQLPENGTYWQIEVDGVWYHWNISGEVTTPPVTKLLDFMPGDSHSDIAIPITDEYQRVRDATELAELVSRQLHGGPVFPELRQSLTLQPGKHTVRVACIAPPARAGIYTPVRAISNPVQITILPAGESEYFNAADQKRSEAESREIKERRERVTHLFQVYARQRESTEGSDELPKFEWADIPILLELGKSTKVLESAPASRSSSLRSSGLEGMVALWLIEGLRKTQLALVRASQIGEESFQWIPLNPICDKEGEEFGNPTSVETHERVLRACEEWWAARGKLPARHAALFHPLDLTGLEWYGPGHYEESGPLETLAIIQPDGSVAKRVVTNHTFYPDHLKHRSGVTLRTIFYALKDPASAKGLRPGDSIDRPFLNEMLAVQKIILHYYDEHGKEVRTEQILSSPTRPAKTGGRSKIGGAIREVGARARLGLEEVFKTRKRKELFGLDLTDAPRETDRARLPDLFEERPPGSTEYQLREDVVVARQPQDWQKGAVYYAPAPERFYLVAEPASPRPPSFYGPFQGPPWQTLGIPEPKAAAQKHRFAIHLVADAVDLSHPEDVSLDQLHLSADAVITEQDLVEYDWDEHTLVLVPEAIERLPKTTTVWGNPFVVVADGQPCYLAAFMGLGSSYLPSVPICYGAFSLPGRPRDSIRIEGRPMTPRGEEPSDPRNHPEVRQVLEELGKLTKADTSATEARRELVRKLFRMLTRERKVPKEYRAGRIATVPRYEWSDIPYLLELAESEQVVERMPDTLIASMPSGPGREGMVALWLIEGLRAEHAGLLKQEQKVKGGRCGGGGVYCLPVSPKCRKQSLGSNDEIAHPEIHHEVLRAYQEWWRMVSSLPPRHAAAFEPLDLTDLTGFGLKGWERWGPIEPYAEMTPDGIVAQRTIWDLRYDEETYEHHPDRKIRTVYYSLKSPADEEGPAMLRSISEGKPPTSGPVSEEMLTVHKIVLHYYDNQGEETRTEEVLPLKAKEETRKTFLGLDLSDVPRTTKWSELPDLFEERPPGSKSYHLRDDVIAARHLDVFLSGAVFYIPRLDIFYVQSDPAYSSKLTYYGPFDGEPWERLGVPKPETEDETNDRQSWLLLTPEGEPLPDTQIFFVPGSTGIGVRNSVIVDRPSLLKARTGERGRFSLPEGYDDHTLIVVSDQGFAEIPAEEITSSTTITLTPWARVEGSLRIGGESLAGEQISLNIDVLQRRPIRFGYDTTTDEAGRFLFDRVRAGTGTVKWRIDTREESKAAYGLGPISHSTLLAYLTTIEIQPGSTAEVTIGGSGCTITGKLTLPPSLAELTPDWTSSTHDLTRDYPLGSGFHEAEIYPFEIAEDGAFVIYAVPEGDHQLKISLYPPGEETRRLLKEFQKTLAGIRSSKRGDPFPLLQSPLKAIAVLTQTIQVKGEQLDLGELQLREPRYAR